jgi:peptidoglycan/xylan/chitin deacetylase (PgdA/CDA1 family)
MTNQTRAAVMHTPRSRMPALQDAWQRALGLYQRKTATLLFRRPLLVRTDRPLVSFTFDDFPRSALHTGGEILNRFHAVGTYYACIGMMGATTATGQQFVIDDLPLLLGKGHELGCHTYAHCHSWDTDPPAFEEAVVKNRSALQQVVPNLRFRTFSYPISPPRPLTKARMARYFSACRGGGQTLNVGITDLNYLRAFFLEKSSDNLQAIRDLIDHNRQVRGWLIFATHDVADAPTPYGVIPEFFESVVRYAVDSGACILPVAEAVEALQNGGAVALPPA